MMMRGLANMVWKVRCSCVVGSAVAAILGSMAAPVAAQEAGQEGAEAASGSVITEVVVTARRREESAQSVPLTVAVVDDEDLLRQDIRTVTDLTRVIPGIDICCSRGNANFPFLRGVPGVVGYFAEVPTNLSGSGLYFDLASAQVLKGPQGTLFGTATNGGAILIEPKRPTSRLEGHASLTFGEDGRFTAEGVVNVPVTQSFTLRMGGLTQEADGYVKNVTTGQKLGNEDYQVARISALWAPSDRFENYFILNYDQAESAALVAVPEGPRAGINPSGLVEQRFGGSALEEWIAQQESLGRYEIVGTSVEGGPKTASRQILIRNVTRFDINEHLTLRNIIGASQLRTFSRTDTDASPFPWFETAPPFRWTGPQREYSEELQLQGSAFSDRLTFVAGTFNSWSRSDEVVPLYSVSLGVTSGLLNDPSTDTNSVYAEGSYDFERVNGLTVTAGYRYTWDDRQIRQVRFDAGGNAIAAVDVSAKWSRGSYRWGLQYELNPGLMFYFTNSKGYSAGGINTTAPPQLQVFDPESLNNFEIGMKADWDLGGMSGRTNLAVFYGDWDDIQSRVTMRVETPTGPQLSVVTANAAKGHIQGVELETTLAPTRSLSFTAYVTYLDGGYDDFMGLDPTGTVLLDLSGLPFLYMPEWKYNLSGSYRLPLGSKGEVHVGADYSWVDEVHTIFGLTPGQFYNWTPSFENLSANVGWSDFMGWRGVDVSLFVTNLTDEYITHGQWGGYESVGQYARQRAVPRRWGLRFQYNF